MQSLAPMWKVPGIRLAVQHENSRKSRSRKQATRLSYRIVCEENQHRTQLWCHRRCSSRLRQVVVAVKYKDGGMPLSRISSLLSLPDNLQDEGLLCFLASGIACSWCRCCLQRRSVICWLPGPSREHIGSPCRGAEEARNHFLPAMGRHGLTHRHRRLSRPIPEARDAWPKVPHTAQGSWRVYREGRTAEGVPQARCQ